MFSVVMPLWNKRHTLAATVASILAQSRRDFEMVIVDDGSTDDSPAVLRGFRDERIRLVAQPHAGPGAARNAGIEASTADWIAFADADDIWLPDHLAELDRIRRAFPEAGLIGTRFVARRDAEARLARFEGAMRIEAINYFDRASRPGNLFCTSTSAIPRSTYSDLGGFGPAPWGQDSEYWARIALARPIAVSSKVTGIYRLASGGITDRFARRGLGRMRSIRDVGPSIALLVDRYAAIGNPAIRRAVDRYIDWRVRVCIRKLARTGDFEALRSLARAGLPAPPIERLIIAIAFLPAAMARPIYASGFAMVRLGRRIAGLPGRLAPLLDRYVPPIAGQDIAEQPTGEQRLEGSGHCV